VDLQDKSGPVETIPEPKKPTVIVERRTRSRFGVTTRSSR
jgi:hypothetical protein